MQRLKLLSMSAVMAKWPTNVDTLVTSPAAAGLTKQMLPYFRHAAAAELDVVFVSKPGGYMTADARPMWHEALLGLFDPFAVTAYADLVPKWLHAMPYRGAGGMYGWDLRHVPAGAPKIVGFAPPPTGPDGVAFAFVAHGVGVVVLASTLSKAQADEVVRALQR